MQISPIHTVGEFEALLVQETGERVIVLEFYTENCNPCSSLLRMLEHLAPQYKDKVLFLKTRADQNAGLAAKFGVRKVPTLILISRERQMERATGVIAEHALKRKLDELTKE